MARPRRHASSIAVVLALCSPLPAADPPPDEEAQRRLEFMKQKLDGFVLSVEGAPNQPLERVKEPLLRYTNPARGGANADGALFLWRAGNRPVAIGCLRIRDGAVWREFTSLTDQSVRCERAGQVVWSPPAGGVSWKPLLDAPKPAATPALRLAQMRRQAERFAGEFAFGTDKNWEALRLLPQPLYRYTLDKTGGDGVIFALAQANDPEALLLLQLAPDGAWTYALARMSSQRLRVRLGDKEVWTASGYWSNPRSRDDPYQETPDGKFPGAVKKE